MFMINAPVHGATLEMKKSKHAVEDEVITKTELDVETLELTFDEYYS